MGPNLCSCRSQPGEFSEESLKTPPQSREELCVGVGGCGGGVCVWVCAHPGTDASVF